MRLDLVQASVETIYVTIWASPNISLHMGKIENAEETWRKHVGVRLQVISPQIEYIFSTINYFSCSILNAN